MIIQTRFKDIPYSEVAKLHHMLKPTDDGETWAKRRGKAIQIVTPDDGNSACGEPNFTVVSDPAGYRAYACPHIAEIGD